MFPAVQDGSHMRHLHTRIACFATQECLGVTLLLLTTTPTRPIQRPPAKGLGGQPAMSFVNLALKKEPDICALTIPFQVNRTREEVAPVLVVDEPPPRTDCHSVLAGYPATARTPGCPRRPTEPPPRVMVPQAKPRTKVGPPTKTHYCQPRQPRNATA